MSRRSIKEPMPGIQFHFNWTHVSVVIGHRRTNCLFGLHVGSIKKEEIKTHRERPFPVIWDGLNVHQSRLGTT